MTSLIGNTGQVHHEPIRLTVPWVATFDPRPAGTSVPRKSQGNATGPSARVEADGVLHPSLSPPPPFWLPKDEWMSQGFKL